MSKTLRVRTRTGWTTKPAPDLPENRLTAGEVDDTLLAVWDRAQASQSVYNVAAYGLDNAGIQSAIDACATAGGGVVYVPAGEYTITTTLVLKSGVFVCGDGPTATILKLGASQNKSVFAVENETTTGIVDFGIGDLLVDGNKEQNEFGYYTNIRIHKSWRGLFVRLHSRGAGKLGQGVEYGIGEGLRFWMGGNHRVFGGRFYDNDYEGIKVRNSFQNSFIGCVFDNNDRAGIQFAMHRENGTSPTAEFINQDWNVVSGCTVSHPTGLAGPSSPYCSGFGLHGCRGVRITGCMVDGTGSGIDMHEYGDDNQIVGNTFRVRPSTQFSASAAIQIWNWNNAPTRNNRFLDNEIYLLGAATRKRALLCEYARDLRFERNRFLLDGAGTWAVEVGNNTLNSRFIDNEFPSGTTFAYGSGTGNLWQWRSGDQLWVRKSDGTLIDLLASVDVTAPTLTGATATATSSTTASGAVTTNEANGTLYWLASANSTETAATVKAAQSQAVSVTGEQTVSASGLTASTTYYMHFVHRDAADNDSTVASTASFATPAAGVDPDDAIIAAIEATDAGAQSTTVKNAISAFYASGVSGGWWSKLAAIYGLVGGTANSHGINWKNPDGTRVTWSGTVTHAANGVQGGGGYGDTGITAASSVARDNNCIGHYCNAQGADLVFEATVGAGGSADAGAFHLAQASNNGVFARLSSVTGSTQPAATYLRSDPVGHVLFQRTGESAAAGYRNNGVITLGTQGSSDAAPINANMSILSRGNIGPTFSGRLALVYWGESLDSGQRTSLHNAVVALQTALGRNV